jgi:hypothetical protein
MVMMYTTPHHSTLHYTTVDVAIPLKIIPYVTPSYCYITAGLTLQIWR